jgi:hypothetical protein
VGYPFIFKRLSIIVSLRGKPSGGAFYRPIPQVLPVFPIFNDTRPQLDPPAATGDE